MAAPKLPQSIISFPWMRSSCAPRRKPQFHLGTMFKEKKMLDDGLERARKLHFVNARDYPFPDALLSVGAKRVVRSMLLALNNELRHRTLLDINAERVHSGSEGGGVDGDMAAGQQMLGQQSNDSVSESVSTQTLSSSTLNPSTLTTTTTTTDIVKAASTSINRNPLIFSPSSTTGPPSLSQVMVQSLADIFIHSAREIHNNNIQNDNNYSIEFGFPSLGRRGTTPTLTKQGSTSTKPYTTFKLGELSSSVGFRSLKGLSWLSSSPSTSSTSSSGSSQSKNKSSSTSTHLLSTSTTLSANSTDIYSPDSTSRLINEMDMKIEPTAISFTYGPYPIPQTHGIQSWFKGFLNYVIPKEVMEYVNYPSQKELEKQAMEAGCYIKLDTMVTFKRPLELRVWDWGSDGSNNSSPRLVHTDQRQSMNIQFITPHFTPWDEIFELVPRGQEEESTATFMGMKREIPEEAGMNNSTSGGGGGGGGGARRWRLRFDWRISDVDYLVTPDLRD